MLSTTRYAPAARAISPSAARSATFISGFDGVSAQISFVFGRSARRTFSGSAMSTAVDSMPQRGRYCFAISRMP